MRKRRNPMIMVVKLEGTGLEEAERDWIEVKENLKGARFAHYRGDLYRKRANVQRNAQVRMIRVFGTYFNSYTEMGKKNPGLYEKLVDDERAFAELI